MKISLNYLDLWHFSPSDLKPKELTTELDLGFVKMAKKGSPGGRERGSAQGAIAMLEIQTLVSCAQRKKGEHTSGGLSLGEFWEFRLAKIPGPATGVIWALRAESCKQSSKMGSRALPPGPGAQKVQNGVEKEST